MHAGIPGTVGGAIRMNAGAYGGELKDILISTKYYDLEKSEIYEISNKEHDFAHRTSVFSNKHCIILSCKIKLFSKDKEEIKERMAFLTTRRKERQPINFPSAGSTFKKAGEISAAKLIDDAGLKGYTVGGAKISELHAGFIINYNNATSNDIKEIIEHTKNVVFEKFNINIEEEIIMIGE